MGAGIEIDQRIPGCCVSGFRKGRSIKMGKFELALHCIDQKLKYACFACVKRKGAGRLVKEKAGKRGNPGNVREFSFNRYGRHRRPATNTNMCSIVLQQRVAHSVSVRLLVS